MARQRSSVERLRRFAEEHLLYEAGMLYEVTVKLMNRHHKDDLIAENALLESFGIHSRNLIDFLWLDKPMKDTDAIASDYVGEWKAPAMSERLSKVKGRVGKEMVHLSYNRLDVSEDEKGWQVLGIGPEITGAFGIFVTAVPLECVSEGWHEHAYAATGAVPPDRAQEVEKQTIRVEDMKPEDLLSSRAAIEAAARATQGLWGVPASRTRHSSSRRQTGNR
jgi:hypothetical protein